MELHICLQQYPWRTLKAIFRAYDLPFTPLPDKPTLCTRLAAVILEPERLQATWHALSSETQAALRALSEADGLMRREVFTARFGSIRPYKPWRDDAPPAPWESPASPAEELAYRGLVFVLNQGSKRRPLWVVVLPDEIETALSPFLEAPMTAPLSPAPPPALPPADISLAILTFLCFLNREDLKPLHGRWLPPNACRTLAPHLPFQDQGWGRSEHQRSCLRNQKSEIRTRAGRLHPLPYLGGNGRGHAGRFPPARPLVGGRDADRPPGLVRRHLPSPISNTRYPTRRRRASSAWIGLSGSTNPFSEVQKTGLSKAQRIDRILCDQASNSLSRFADSPVRLLLKSDDGIIVP